MKTTRIRRAVILVTAAGLVLGLGAIGIAAALGNGSPSHQGASHTSAPSTAAAALDPATVRPATPTRSIAPTVSPTPDPNLLADGIYPTYIRGIDVQGGTITVDVLQTFFGADAHQAAIGDGVPWKDVRYAPVYIRNENPLLRTLPVARDVKIKLIGTCDAPNRWIGLMRLRAETTPFTDTFYYDVTVVDGAIERVDELVATAGC